jgi:hypothetical protein
MMTEATNRDSKHDGDKPDPNAGRQAPGDNMRPMSDWERLAISSNDSMAQAVANRDTFKQFHASELTRRDGMSDQQ